MNRRQFLLAGSSAAATAGLAGCTDFIGGDGGDISDVGTWLPDPRDIDSDLDHYSFEARSPAAQAEAVDDLVLETTFRPSLDFGSVSVTDVDNTVSASMSTGSANYSFDLYFGSFDADWIETNVRNGGYGRDRSEGDLTIYEDGDDVRSHAIAVSGDTVIEASHDGEDADATRLVTTLLDTEAGEVSRYTDALSDMSDLLDRLPGGHQVTGETFERTENNDPEFGEFRNQVASGRSETITGREIDRSEVLVFLDEADVVERDIDRYIEESGQFADFLGQPSYEIAGRTVTISGTTPYSF